MYYIERGLGPAFRPLAIFFAIMLGFTAFLTGNAIQANTVADSLLSSFGIPVWISGLTTAAIVSLVVLGGIRRIGRVTSVLAPFMATVYVLGALTIILLHFEWFLPGLALIFTEAFTPSAGVAGTGIGTLLLTMMWGVRRGLFSNEAGQGSAPIAHAAAKTDEPVSEGVVALLEPFIDTLVICTMTGLVIVMTGVWQDRIPTQIQFAGAGDLSYVEYAADGRRAMVVPEQDIRIDDGYHAETGPGAPLVAWHELELERLYVDEAQTVPFTGVISPRESNRAGVAIAADGTRYDALHADAAESGAPLTMLGFEKGLPGRWGDYIVLLSVMLFAVSTAISWSYYGDRCANYLFGPRAILPYKMVFVAMHFFGAIVSLNVIWLMGDVALGIVILPNLLGLILLSGKVKQLTDSYFERKPWIENYEVRKRLKAERHR
jgi:AGCS family alanine or glycine:cation symporter